MNHTPKNHILLGAVLLSLSVIMLFYSHALVVISVIAVIISVIYLLFRVKALESKIENVAIDAIAAHEKIETMNFEVEKVDTGLEEIHENMRVLYIQAQGKQARNN